MLYHSQQMTTQYWLTPLLKFLLENNNENAELYLKHLDNNLLCSEANAPLIKRTHRYLVNAWYTEAVLDANISLNQIYSNGTQYPHYWFYKLEYILYLKLKSKDSKLVDNFRMTAKNSVEHVTPQNPRIKKEVISDDLLHTFGNLALVTGSVNSEMTDDGFTVKQAKFKERHKGKGVSLKLEYIYENTQWKKEEIETHHNKMIEEFNLYLSAVSTKCKGIAK
ncbi:HNH endonuclease [Marinomonas sp. IMCC 4694]|nr:HNH endonuclease [Marinomonas sp. IMCC 4694]